MTAAGPVDDKSMPTFRSACAAETSANAAHAKARRKKAAVDTM
jgi:hypothetical protein